MAVLAAIPPPANAPVLSGPAPVAAPVMAAGSGPGAQVISMGGMRAVPLAVMEAERTRKEESEQVQASPIATGVAAHIKTCFSQAWQAKRNTVQPAFWMRSGPAVASTTRPSCALTSREQGGSEVWAGLTSSKCRAAGGLAAGT
jgi:hypothetical protein